MVLISRFEHVNRLVVVIRWVVFRFIDRMVWAPFDDKSAFLNEGAALNVR